MIKSKGDRFGSSWSEAKIARQPRPYVRPLPYDMRSGQWTGNTNRIRFNDIRNNMPIANGNNDNAKQSMVESSNKALEKLYGELNQAESLVVAWKERQMAIDLVTSNVRRLITIARAVKRRDPKIVRRVLKRNPKAKDIVKQPAGLWLEYHFGIVPTIMDIHHGMGILGYEFPVQKLSCSSIASNTFNTPPPGPKKSGYYRQGSFTTITKIGGEIYALNPNVHLGTMLGFGQPLSVVWETTPFSWFVDYIVNVGSMLKNLEPRFPGVKVRNCYTTTLVKGSGLLLYKSSSNAMDFASYRSAHMSRTTTWPSYQLEFKSPLDLSGQKCSYVVAVLTQLLTGMKKR